MRRMLFLLAFLLLLPFSFAAEPDNSVANASWIPTDGTWENHSFEYAGDADFVKFNATRGAYYLIRTVNLTPAAITDTQLYLFDTDGSTALSADNAGLVSNDWSARIVWMAQLNGTYYVKVNESNSTAGGEYNISVEKQGTLNPYLISPSSWMNVSRGSVFNFTAGVTCVGGPCRDVRAILDPETEEAAVKIAPEVSSAVDEDGEVRVIIKLKDKPVESLTIEDIANFKKSKKARQAFMEQFKALEAEQKKELRQRLKQQIKDSQDSVLGNLDVIDARDKRRGRLAAMGDVDFKMGQRYSNINAFSGTVTRSGLEKLMQDPDVEYIYPVRSAQIMLGDSVPLIRADEVWNIQLNSINVTGAGQTVCILDTGINYNHVDFDGVNGTLNTFIGGYDFVNGDADPIDDNGHGSHVAGIVASQDATYRGVAPGSKIVMIKVCNAGGNCDFDDVVAGIDWCIDNSSALNISVISMSIGTWYVYDNDGFGCDDFDPVVSQAIDSAVAANLFVAVAAGNRYAVGDVGIAMPACMRNATSVGITSKSDTVVSWGQRSFNLDIVAPGLNIASTDYVGTQTTMSGTSMSTPHVAGVAALVQQYFSAKYGRTLSPREVEWLLKFNGVGIPDAATGLTFPRVDAYASVTAKGAVSTAFGARPFYTTTANPHDSSCLDLMAAGSSCNVTWSVVATGDLQNYTFFTIFETGYTSNTTSRLNMTITDSTPPSLSLVAPAADANVSSALQSFSFNVSDDSASSMNCSLVVNGNMVNYTVVTNNVSGTVSYTLPSEGVYAWNVSCSDGTNLNESSSRSLTYDATPPVIALGSPGDGAALQSNVSDFIFYVTDNAFQSFVCDLYVGGTKRSSNASVANNTNTTFASVSLVAGSLSWLVNCTDPASNMASSSSRTVIVPQENSTVSVSATAGVSFQIAGTAGVDVNLTSIQDVTGDFSVVQYNTAPVNVSASSANGFAALGIGTFVSLDASAAIEGNLSWYLLTIYYSGASLPSDIDESTLRVYYFNETSQQWQLEQDSGVNASGDYVWANITHFSVFSAGGAQQSTPPSGGGGGGGGGGGTSTTIVPTIGGVDVLIGKLSKSQLLVSSSLYPLRLVRASSVEVVFTVNNVYYSLNLFDKTINIDVDADGSKDITIALVDLGKDQATFKFKQYVEPIRTMPVLPDAYYKSRRKPVEAPQPEQVVVEEPPQLAALPAAVETVAQVLPQPAPAVEPWFSGRNALMLLVVVVAAMAGLLTFLFLHSYEKQKV